MGRIHIPFRFGEPGKLSRDTISQFAAEARDKAIAADDPLAGTAKKLKLRNALKVYGGRLTPHYDNTIPLKQQLSLEVWEVGDFVVHEDIVTLGRNTTLRCFALLGSYILHYKNFAEEKWTAEDGSAIGMQWAYLPSHPGGMKDLASREAFLFAQEVVAPRAEMEAAITQFGEKDFWLAFHENMTESQALIRAKNLGLITPAEPGPVSA